MAIKKTKPEEIVAKFRKVEVLMGRGVPRWCKLNLPLKGPRVHRGGRQRLDLVSLNSP